MDERSEIIEKIVKLNTSMSRRRSSMKRSDDAGYVSIVKRSLKLDEEKLERLHIQLADWA